MKRLTVLVALVASLLASPIVAQEQVADRATLERDVRVLADDSMAGRAAGEPGYAMAADYVAARFAELGLQPGGDEGSWFQDFQLVRTRAAFDTRLAIRTSSGERIKAEYARQFVGGGMPSAGGGDMRGEVEAEIVFVGYGLDLPELGHDDLSGVDLEGKIALWVYQLPEGLDPLLASHLRQAGADRFARYGAVGSIMLWTPQLETQLSWLQGRGFLGDTGTLTWRGPDGVPFDRGGDMEFQLVASPEFSRLLLEGHEFDFEDVAAAQANGMAPMPGFATGVTARVTFSNEAVPRLETSNVIAIQPGTDPALAEQYVVVTAHLDHVGTADGPVPDGDRIYNGAMDNASGVSAMMEMARLLSQDPPRRPVMFVALGAEEVGLLGSSYHAANPGLEQGEIVANVNVDMPILTWPFSDIVPFGADRSNIWEPVSSAAATYRLKLVPDPNPDEGFFFRSDQYSYVRQGIPAVYLDIGFGNGGEEAQTQFLNAHYHQTSDEADLLDYEQLGRFAELATLVARNIADMDERPAWRAGDFFGSTFGGPVVGETD